MKLIILDRDGVINEDSEHFIKTAKQWIPIPNSADAIAFLNQYHYLTAIATNQSGLARGLFTMHELNQIHNKMLKHINSAGGNIEGIWFCPHLEQDHCRCRKPRTGMLQDIFMRLGVAAKDSYLVGDSLRDLQCIESVGGKPILVLTGKGKQTLATRKLPQDTLVYDDLWSFAQALCNSQEME